MSQQKPSTAQQQQTPIQPPVQPAAPRPLDASVLGQVSGGVTTTSSPNTTW